MSLRTDWHPVASADLRAIPWRTAARLAAAVEHFAATGEGDFKRISPTDPRRLRLFVPGAVAVLFVSMETRTVHIGRAFERS